MAGRSRSGPVRRSSLRMTASAAEERLCVWTRAMGKTRPQLIQSYEPRRYCWTTGRPGRFFPDRAGRELDTRPAGACASAKWRV